MSRYIPAEGQADFPALENQILDWWSAERIFEKSIEQRSEGPDWVFYDGPPGTNGKPHIGHCYTTLVCDVWARFMRRAGRDVFFLTGTDEHGAKVEKAATEHRMTPQAWADQNAAEFRSVLGMLDLTNDDFIRTTEPRHTRQVQTFVRRLLEKDAVYVGEFEGWYD